MAGFDDVGELKMTTLGNDTVKGDDPRRQKKGALFSMSLHDLVWELCVRGYDVKISQPEAWVLERRRAAAKKRGVLEDVQKTSGKF